MHKTGIEAYYALRDGKRLRFGYTTGTCAAAAAKAAAVGLLRGTVPETVGILTPRGIALELEVVDGRTGPEGASCAVRKFSGDDPDVTDGILIYAQAQWQAQPGVSIDGGEGVGRVTKPGLKQKIGEAAINPVPRQMIERAVEEVLDDCGRAEGVRILIRIPQGRALAAKTFNPRLGIEGGLSVLGTSGIVEPMSEEALVESIRLELSQKKALGCERLLVSPGNYGADFLRTLCRVEEKELVKCANYIGKTIDMAAVCGYRELLFISHIGKFIKLAGGIMNTHSREADARAEIMASCALRAGCTAPCARRILESITTDEMLEILKDERILRQTMQIVKQRIDFYLKYRAKGQLEIGAVIFSNETGILCMTGNAPKWLEELKERT